MPSIDPNRHNFMWNNGTCLCTDIGSSHSIAVERIHQVFKNKGILFQETTLTIMLADGQQTTGEALTTQVKVEIEGRSVLTKFIILPKAKGDIILLGTDFLSSAGLVLDVKNICWYFWDNPTHKYPFGEELDTPSKAKKMPSNTCQLREGEGGEATNILDHKINTGNIPPTSVPPYIMFHVKKEILRKEIEDLLEKDIIEKCESPYGAPVVLITKPNSDIIMSHIFEQHLADMDVWFKRLMDLKLRANREKCQFYFSHVKYQGLWIILQGTEVYHKKTLAILGIPPPKNVKHMQSFLQT
ncbi:retrovirus-related Pol polyprotein from transposon 17.6 [Trichonephila clavipes]|nr:retrovirus-related Pol polyprotein from transposon 17.6 [Trichonephila clavipes]